VLSVPKTGHYKKFDVKKTPFNIQMNNILFQSLEVLSNRTNKNKVILLNNTLTQHDVLQSSITFLFLQFLVEPVRRPKSFSAIMELLRFLDLALPGACFHGSVLLN